MGAPDGKRRRGASGKMKAMAEKSKEPKRQNKTVGVGDVIGGALDPVFKKRGFASRDIIAHWPAIAPPPFDRVTMPDKLVWPRGERSAEGATLYLRCIPGHGLSVTHEGPRIAAAVNRYFGYVLVGQVRLSAEPFSPHSAAADQGSGEPTAEVAARVSDAVAQVEDEGLREALRRLGHGLMGKRKSGQSL